MQSLSFLYTAGCEWLLGPSYAALAWGNFALALVLFAAVLLLLDGPVDLSALVAALAARQIHVSYRLGRMRVAPGVWNEPDDVARFARAVHELLGVRA